MRILVASLFLLAVAVLVMSGVQAGEKDKAVTIKGSITCAKCDLGKEATCMTVIVAKDKDKTVYYFDTASHKKYHKEVCTEAKPGAVEGVVSEKGEKKIITVKKLTYDK